MPAVTRVLDRSPVPSLGVWFEGEGRTGYEAALRLDPDEVIDLVEASGLRGRGGAGFPTGVKWRSVRERAKSERPTVVINAAEGEPGSFKDRAILRANPYRVLEGALIAAHALGATDVIVGIKETFTAEIDRVRAAAAEFIASEWTGEIEIRVVAGPPAYLLGEETGLLEAAAGRPPFPRIAPPYRHGADELTASPGEAAQTVMADEHNDTSAPPTLVNNVETLANVPFIFAEGVDAFRSVGTPDTPGTVVVTISGDTRRHGVVEVAMGTPLSETIEIAGGGARDDRQFVAAMSGVSNPLIPAARFETPLTHEHMAQVGTGLGAAGFIVFDDQTDVVAVAAGVARFLAVESCGQCRPCKHDGVAIANELDRLRSSEADEASRTTLVERLGTVADGARCALAGQQQLVVGSVLELFDDHVWTHAQGGAAASEPYLIAPIVDLVDDRFVLDTAQTDKLPDWTVGEWDEWDGSSPAETVDVGVTLS